MKNPPLSTLVKKLDKIFSEYIRRRDSKDGVARCVTCGKYENWKEIDCGHFVSRDKKSTRWNEKNCHPQCKSCNRFHEGRKDEYALFLIRKYGQGILEELNKNKWMPFKLDTLWLQEMIKEYKEKLNAL